MLIDLGRLAPERLEDVLRTCRETGTRFGECAVAMGLVTAHDVDDAIRTKVEEEVVDLFFWPGAQYELFAGEPSASYREGRYHAASHTCELTPFLEALLVRVAERRTFVGRLPTGREVFELDDFADLSGRRGDIADLLGEFDGSRIVTDVIEASGLRRSTAWREVLAAEQEGLVRRLESTEAKPVVDAAIDREIMTLESMLDRAVDAAVVRIRLARACEEAGQIPRAASHWRHAGDERRARGDVAGAISCFSDCVRLVPTDFASREKILDIHHQRREYAEVVAQGRPLADLLVKHNLLNRAKRLLLQLVSIEPKNPALRLQLVNVLTGLGEQGVALHHLRELGAILESMNAPDEQVLDCYLRILAVDPNNEKAKRCIDRLTGVTAQRKVTWITAACTLVGLALAGGAFLYEAAAREEIAFSLDAVERRLASQDHAGARRELSAALSAHSFSLAARGARHVLRDIDALEKDAARAAGGADDARAKALRARESQADGAKAQIDMLIAEGDIDAAREAAAQLVSDYGSTASVRRGEVNAPLRITVVPDDATITVDGVARGTGSQTITYDPVRTRRIVVSREGLADRVIAVNGVLDDASTSVWLSPPIAWSYTAAGELASTPLVTDDIVVVAGRDRRVHALSVEDGSVVWRTEMGFYAEMSASPIRVDDGVVVVTGAGEAVCLDLATGDEVWKRSLGIPIEAQPFATRGANGLVVLALSDGRLMGLSQRDGATRWDLGPQTIARDTAPRLLGDSLFAYVGATRGLAVARIGDGRSIVRPTRDLGLVTSPVVAFGRVWAAARDRTLRLISTEDGTSIDSFPVPGGAPCAPCVVGEVVYVPARDGTLLALRGDGEEAFRKALPEVAAASPVHEDGVLFVPGAERRLMAVDATSGAIRWQLDCGSAVLATPALTPDLIIVATSGGRLIALRK